MSFAMCGHVHLQKRLQEWTQSIHSAVPPEPWSLVTFTFLFTHFCNCFNFLQDCVNHQLYFIRALGRWIPDVEGPLYHTLQMPVTQRADSLWAGLGPRCLPACRLLSETSLLSVWCGAHGVVSMELDWKACRCQSAKKCPLETQAAYRCRITKPQMVVTHSPQHLS